MSVFGIVWRVILPIRLAKPRIPGPRTRPVSELPYPPAMFDFGHANLRARVLIRHVRKSSPHALKDVGPSLTSGLGSEPTQWQKLSRVQILGLGTTITRAPTITLCE
jgi:hypothetical protein